MSSASPRKPTGRTGAVPFALAQKLEAGEAVVWWDTVDRMAWRGPGILAIVGVLVLLAVGLAVPELWALPIDELSRAAAVCVAPGVAQALRNWLAQRTVVVTDGAIIDADRHGRGDRLRLANIRMVRRDWWTGGVILQGAAHQIRIPPVLAPDVQRQLRRQREVMLMRDERALDDRLGWLA